MKKAAVFLVLFLSLIGGNWVFAQGQRGPGRPGGPGSMGGTPEERATNNTNRLAEILGLSEEQKTGVQAINLKYATKIDSLRNAAPGQGQGRELAMKMDESRDAEISALLTEEQQVTFKEHKQKMMNRRKEMMDKRGKGGTKPGEGPQN